MIGSKKPKVSTYTCKLYFIHSNIKQFLVLFFKGMSLISETSTKKGAELIAAAAALPDYEVPDSSLKIKMAGYPTLTDGEF